MPDLEDIVQRITLSGQDEIIQSFGEMGKAGEEAFKNIAEAAGEMGKVIAGAAGAFGALVASTGLWARHSAEAAHSLENLAAQTGESVESMSALQGAMAALGGESERLGFAFRRMGMTIAREWEQIKKDVSEATDRALEAGFKVQNAENALWHARDERRKAMGEHGATPSELRQQKQLEATLKEREAQENLRKADKARIDEQMNSYERVSKAVKSITDGQKTYEEASKDANLNVNNVLKGLVGNTEGAQEALKKFNGSFYDIVGTGPKVKEVFYNFADYLKNAHNATEEQSIAMRLFGRAVGEDVLAPMRKLGSEGFREQEREMEKYGLIMTHSMIDTGVKFHEEYSKLSSVLSTTANQMGLLFAPSFTEGMRDLSEYLIKNHDAMMKWATDLSTKITPYITGFFDSLKGLAAYLSDSPLEKGTNAEAWEQSWKRIGTVVSTVAETIKTAIKGISSAIEALSSSTGLKPLEAAFYAFAGLATWKVIGGMIGKNILAGIGVELAAGIAGLAEGALLLFRHQQLKQQKEKFLVEHGFTEKEAREFSDKPYGEQEKELKRRGLWEGPDLTPAEKGEFEKSREPVTTKPAAPAVPGGMTVEDIRRRLAGEEKPSPPVIGEPDFWQKLFPNLWGTQGAPAPPVPHPAPEFQKRQKELKEWQELQEKQKKLDAEQRRATEGEHKPEEHPAQAPSTTPSQTWPPPPGSLQRIELERRGFRFPPQPSPTFPQSEQERVDRERRGIHVVPPPSTFPPQNEYDRIQLEQRGFRFAPPPPPPPPPPKEEHKSEVDAATKVTESRLPGAMDNAATAAERLATALNTAAGAADSEATKKTAATTTTTSSSGNAVEAAGGGPISGFGSGKSDNVPIMASVGEFVVRADGSNLGDAMAYFGHHFLGAGRFQEGGPIDDDSNKGKFLLPHDELTDRPIGRSPPIEPLPSRSSGHRSGGGGGGGGSTAAKAPTVIDERKFKRGQQNIVDLGGGDVSVLSYAEGGPVLDQGDTDLLRWAANTIGSVAGTPVAGTPVAGTPVAGGLGISKKRAAGPHETGRGGDAGGGGLPLGQGFTGSLHQIEKNWAYAVHHTGLDEALKQSESDWNTMMRMWLGGRVRGYQEGGEVEGDKNGGGGGGDESGGAPPPSSESGGDEGGGGELGSLLKWTVAPHVVGMALHAIANRFHVPLPGITDPTSRAMYLGGEGGKDVKASDIAMAAFPGLEMLDMAKKDAERGSPMRSKLRAMFGIDDPKEPAPWQPGGSFHQMAAGGLVGGFVNSVAARGYSEGGAVMAAPVAPPSGISGFHQLDLRTDQGVLRVAVSANTMEQLRSSTLGSKMTATGPRPSWYS